MTGPPDDLDWFDSPTGSVGVVRPLIELVPDTVCDDDWPEHRVCMMADGWTWRPEPLRDSG